MYTVSPAVQDTVRCFFHKKAHLRYRTSCLRHGFRYKRSGGGIRARKGFRDAAFRIRFRITPAHGAELLPQDRSSAAKRNPLSKAFRTAQRACLPGHPPFVPCGTEFRAGFLRRIARCCPFGMPDRRSRSYRHYGFSDYKAFYHN